MLKHLKREKEILQYSSKNIVQKKICAKEEGEKGPKVKQILVIPMG